MENRRIKVLVIDDEEIARDKAIQYLQRVGKEIDIEQAENGLIGLEKIKIYSPDIVLLDVEMPELNGIQMLYQVEEKNFEVIFQTAYPQFSKKAFEQEAVDYLVKPYPIEKFIFAYEKVINKIAFNKENNNIFYKNDIYDYLKRKNLYLDNILVEAKERKIIIPVSNIIYFQNKFISTLVVWMENKKILRSDNCECSFDKIEKKLDPRIFHKYGTEYLVKKTEIKEESQNEKEFSLKLSNGTEITYFKK